MLHVGERRLNVLLDRYGVETVEAVIDEVRTARVPIVPVYVSGTNRIRSCMARRAKVRVTVGSPLPPELWFPAGETSTLAGRALYQAISDRVMQESAHLRREQEETTRSGVAPATSPSSTADSHERGGST